MSNGLALFMVIDVTTIISCILILIVETYLKGYWHFPNFKLDFIPFRYYMWQNEEKNTRYIEMFVGNTKLHATMKVGMRTDGKFDWNIFMIDGLGSSYACRPGLGTDVLAVHSSIIHLLKECQQNTPIPIKLEENFAVDIKKLLDQVDNLKFVERIGS